MGLIRLLFLKRKHLVYTTFGNESYYLASSRLSGAGIQYDAKLKLTANVYGTSSHAADQFVRNSIVDTTQYDFFVSKEDQYRAEQALRM